MSKFEGWPGKLRRPDLKKLLQERSSLSFTVSDPLNIRGLWLPASMSFASTVFPVKLQVDEKNSS